VRRFRGGEKKEGEDQVDKGQIYIWREGEKDVDYTKYLKSFLFSEKREKTAVFGSFT